MLGKGFGNPVGIWVWVLRVRVRVQIREPLKNLYPHQRSGDTCGICHGFFVLYNLDPMSLLVVSYLNYEMVIFLKTVLHSSISSIIVEHGSGV